MKNQLILFVTLTTFLFLVLFPSIVYSQAQKTAIIVELDTAKHSLNVTQKITFYNHSKDTLQQIYLHNWINSYKDRKTPLSKRLIEDYDKSLYFAKKKNRGFSKIKSITNLSNSTPLIINESIPDIVQVRLNKSLFPKDSVVLQANYIVKLPNSKFTRYGFHKKGYDLRYWYLTPAVYNKKWQTMSNFNMDDLYSYPTDYTIAFTMPNNLTLESNLKFANIESKNNKRAYILNGNNQSEAEIIIRKNKDNFITFDTNTPKIVTNFTNKKIKKSLANTIINRQLHFIESYLGKHPYDKILVNKIIYHKNPVYGLNQMPSFLNPFDDIFKYDLQFFKALSNRFIRTSLPGNMRTDYWMNDAIQTYLMLKYVEKYYPEKKALGGVSNIWGIRSYKLAQLDFNDKYAFVHQFAMRKNLDQALQTSTDSLSTFNRKIVNKYKAGLGLVYLNDFLGKDIIPKSIKEYYTKNVLELKPNNSFKNLVESKTNKDLEWFFGDYLQTNKKIDYTIQKVKKLQDSLSIKIKNKSNFTAPISIYGIKNKKIKYKKWIENVADFSTIKIPKGDFDKISLNYEAKYPEIYLNNNWKNLNKTIFNKPLQFRFIKDIDNPYYNQTFFNVDYDYNYYDGVIMGLGLTNQTLFKKKWMYSIHPMYSLKNNEINGAFGAKYSHYPKSHLSINKLVSGFSYSRYNYGENLKYQRLSPYISITFNRKSLRDVGGKYLSARYLVVNKEIDETITNKDPNNYAVFDIRYGSFKPNIIHNLYYNFDFQLSNDFSKLNFVVQYRKLRKNNTQIDLRVFAGSFIYNKTTTNFYDYSLNRPSDYLFDYKYFGRSESKNFLSQQIIIAEGGFKSIFDKNTANQWMLTSNNSIGIWRWVELYGDIGIYKNSGFDAQLKYDSGIRFNFVQNFFEIYFPLQSSNGFEMSQEKYSDKIRFVMTLSINKIYNFIKRGFY